MAFGLAGLATSWRAATTMHLAPGWVAEALVVVAAVVWGASVGVYGRYALSSRTALPADLHDRVAGPFASLVPIIPLLLVADGVAPYSRALAAVLVDVLVVATVLLGGWFTGTWMRGGLDLDQLHPGYFLPTVAGGLVAAAAAADVGQHRLAQVMFGLGLVCWAVLGSMILGRMFFRPPLPAPLAPTMAIEVAPPAVASIAYFALDGGRLDLFAAILAGYGLLMVVSQLPLLPVYARLRFSLGTWAFTFSWAAVATATLVWVHDGHPAGERAYSYLVLAAVSLLVAAVAARTAVALARRQLIPPPLRPAPPAHG